MVYIIPPINSNSDLQTAPERKSKYNFHRSSTTVVSIMANTMHRKREMTMLNSLKDYLRLSISHSRDSSVKVISKHLIHFAY